MTVTSHDAVGLIEIQRPEALNAINEQVRLALPAALEELERDPAVRVIVVTGAGTRAFCVGADLKENTMGTTPARSVSSRSSFIETFDEIKKPVVAAVQGYCIGGGFEIALACDIRIAAEDASFGFPETRLGLIPGAGGTQRLSRALPVSIALDLLFTGRRLDALEAVRLGIVLRAVEPATLRAEVLAYARSLALLPPLAIRAVKEAVKRGMDLKLREGLCLERGLFEGLQMTNDRLEALAAFREKRAGTFNGT